MATFASGVVLTYPAWVRVGGSVIAIFPAEVSTAIGTNDVTMDANATTAADIAAVWIVMMLCRFARDNEHVGSLYGVIAEYSTRVRSFVRTAFMIVTVVVPPP